MDHQYIKGVVEGFYGRPWTWQERMDILSYLEGQYNLYIYAPKEDQYHRELWRKDYPESFMKTFEKLVRHGKKKNIEVSLALSPGLSLVYSDENDLNRVCDKFKAFSKIGVTTFCLFFDDIPERLVHESDQKAFSSLANAQSVFTNAVYQKMKGQVENLQFIMCPTLYHGEQVNAYHHELGEKIQPGIEIMWTGRQVCSEKIEAKEAEMISKVFQRPVLYWDNYPVNDSSMAPELHIGPYTGRDANLYQHASGIILNPMSRAYASLIALYNAGEYFEQKEHYDPLNSWKNAIKKLVPQCHEAFLEFAQANMKSPLEKEHSARIKAILKEFESLYKDKKREKAAEYLTIQGKRIQANAKAIEENSPPKLLDDIRMWLEAYNHWGKTITLVGQIIHADLSMYREDSSQENLDTVTAQNDRLEKRLKEAVSFQTSIFGDDLFSFALNRLRISKGLVSMYRY